MDSPSMQLAREADGSLINVDGPPSSPFISEIEQSRIASKSYAKELHKESNEDPTMEVFMTPAKSTYSAVDMEDKENIPQLHNASQNIKATPQKTASPSLQSSRRPGSVLQDRNINSDADLMPPPPSSRKVRGTPKRSPLKAMAPTPRSAYRSASPEQEGGTNEQSTSTFKAALDMRASQMSLPSQDFGNIDDTCFSAFSEIPDMTSFAKLGQSPTKPVESVQTPGCRRADVTPGTSRKRASNSRSPSPTPRRHKISAPAGHDGTTSFLIDFTQQMENVSEYRTTSPNKMHSDTNLLQHLRNQRSPVKSARQSFATPSKSLINLLDFELPPAPTPRSVPTITVRELESLKSSYLSQISSLKATLSGREAEVESLKRAVGDAERRAGEAQESLREERCRREQVEEEKAGWEKRGQEVENVLKNVKEEVMKSEVEKEELLRKLDEFEKRADDAEARAVKAEERFADALASRVNSCEGDAAAIDEQVQRLVAVQLDSKIEAVSRELHTVYKEKHERKVATLKKSYEARGERKCAELQSRLAELEKQHEDLQALKDATFSGPLPDLANSSSAEAELKAQMEEQKAYVARLEHEMEVSRQQQEQLMQELKQERIEKGDLVAAVDEMLALQSDQGPSQSAMTVVEDFRKSISRPTGLRAPSGLAVSLESKIGRGGPATLGRSTSGIGKSKMLANIERMGRTASGGNATSE